MMVENPGTGRTTTNGLRRYLTRLQSAGDEATGVVACREACASLGFSKAMFSWVEGSSWTPEHVFVGPDVGDEFDALRTAVDGTSVPLMRAPREADLVRYRRPYVLERGGYHRDAYRPLIDLSDPAAYAAAPIIANGRTVAILHVDRDRRPITDNDLQLLLLATRICGSVITTAENRRLLRRDADTLQRLFDGVLNPTRPTRVGAFGAATTDDGHTFRLADDPAPQLSDREQAVLRLLATGATNRQIAADMFISEGTVKSHVRHIFRKLGIDSRAQAAAFHRESRIGTAAER
ncbi:response regulator transcription factor [Gordonia terrae]|uniref:helix-turn-helix transcriptional regulator n=1 Tax=Gordonia terrae TaxID=2055 RepID=UPI003F6D82AC